MSAEGPWLFLDGGELNFGMVRDSTLKDTKDFETFAERFEPAAFVGVESLAVTSTVRPNGESTIPNDNAAALCTASLHDKAPDSLARFLLSVRVRGSGSRTVAGRGRMALRNGARESGERVMSMRRTVGFMAGFVAGSLTLVGFGASAGADPSKQTKTFEFAGQAQEFEVPEHVCSVTIDAFGAQGGNPSTSGGGSQPGLGGQATAEIDTTPGKTLTVLVGGTGGDASGGVGGTAGFNGGGAGGTAGSNGGGGGGGASEVRRGAQRLVVAGGGAGGGGFGDTGEGLGGDGGGTTGGGGTGNLGNPPDATGGGGGTQGAGGGAGQNSDTTTTATPGGPGSGGAGAGASPYNGGGGGGGGGLFGGGGGGAVEPGQGAAGGGGGGSGFTPDGSGMTNGVREGDGEVTISYTPSPDCDDKDHEPTTTTTPTPAAQPVAVEPTFTG